MAESKRSLDGTRQVQATAARSWGRVPQGFGAAVLYACTPFQPNLAGVTASALPSPSRAARAGLAAEPTVRDALGDSHLRRQSRRPLEQTRRKHVMVRAARTAVGLGRALRAQCLPVALRAPLHRPCALIVDEAGRQAGGSGDGGTAWGPRTWRR